MIDKELHIIISAGLTLTVGPVAALVIGAAVEANDVQYGDVSHCIDDMAANCVGVLIGILIKKLC